MSPLNRYLTRPLVFAVLAVATVVAVGEPVQTPRVEQAAPVVEVLPAVAEAETAPPSRQRADRASQLRWLITLPNARTSCCRRPV
jgi:hypothetical protein